MEKPGFIICWAGTENLLQQKYYLDPIKWIYSTWKFMLVLLHVIGIKGH